MPRRSWKRLSSFCVILTIILWVQYGIRGAYRESTEGQSPLRVAAVADVDRMASGPHETGPHRPSLQNITKVQLYSSPQLPRRLSAAQHDRLVQLMEELDQLFHRANITYVLLSGTLLGSYVAHDILPWDDDIDIMVNWADVPKIKRLFQNATLWDRYAVHSYEEKKNHREYDREELLKFPADAPDSVFYQVRFGETPEVEPQHKFKFFFKDGDPMPKQGKWTPDWTWPFIDVIFFKEDETRIHKIWKTSVKSIPRSSFYPIKYRPLSRLWLPVPFDTNEFLRMEFQSFSCKGHPWNHVTGQMQDYTQIPCSELTPYYPFVLRTRAEDGATIETLLLNKSVVQTIKMEDSYRPIREQIGLQIDDFNLPTRQQ